MQSFTEARYARLHLPVVSAGIFSLAAALTLIVSGRKSQGWLGNQMDGIATTGQTFWIDLQTWSRSWACFFRERRAYAAGLLSITLVGTLARLAFVNQPVGYDESYTFVAFASHPISFIISDYHVPNNHVFHTLLVYLASHLLGNPVWVIRLPALIAGILIIPATYWVATSFYNHPAALLSAGLAAASSILIEHSTNARGYTMVCLFSLVIIGIAAYVKDHKNLAAWAAFILISTLGFYTIPIMLYPFGMVLTWLFFSFLLRDTGPGYGRSFLINLITAGALVSMLTLVLYLPIFRNSGVASVTSNRFVAPLTWDAFLESIPGRIAATWREWNRDLPAVTGALFLAGLVLGIVQQPWNAKGRAPLWLAGLAWIGPVLVVQQVAPWPRVWLFLLPLFLIWSSAGWVSLFQRIFLRKIASLPGWYRWVLVVMILALSTGLSAGVVRAKSPMLARDTGTFGDVEDAALFLKGQLRPGDTVLVTSPSNYPLHYYFIRYDIPVRFLYKRTEGDQFQRALVLVNPGYGQSLQSVLVDLELVKTLDASTARPVHQYEGASIYEIRNSAAAK